MSRVDAAGDHRDFNFPSARPRRGSSVDSQRGCGHAHVQASARRSRHRPSTPCRPNSAASAGNPKMGTAMLRPRALIRPIRSAMRTTFRRLHIVVSPAILARAVVHFERAAFGQRSTGSTVVEQPDASGTNRRMRGWQVYAPGMRKCLRECRKSQTTVLRGSCRRTNFGEALADTKCGCSAEGSRNTKRSLDIYAQRPLQCDRCNKSRRIPFTA